MTKRDEEDDWVETVTRWAASVGFNPVRVRWKLKALQRRFQGTSSTGRRVELGPPKVSMVLGLCMAVAYVRLMMVSPEGPFEALLTMDRVTLYVHGSFIPHYFWQGQWWRIVTSMFLHIGMWHLAFNLFALAIVGPYVEEMYGGTRALFLFILTGVVANLVSAYFNPGGNAGASGALLGLIGVAAGRGQRSGTQHGRNVRNLMLQWLAYTLIFGFFIGADNAAHAGGFAIGGVLGFVLDPRWLRRPLGRAVGSVAGAVGVIVVALSTYLVLFPPLGAL